MKTRILLAGLALFAFTTIGVAQGTAKKAEAPAKTGCGTQCSKGDAKSCCDATKADKAPAAKTATTAKKEVVKTTPKK